jgi:hypothetical protein
MNAFCWTSRVFVFEVEPTIVEKDKRCVSIVDPSRVEKKTR